VTDKIIIFAEIHLTIIVRLLDLIN